MPDKPPANAFEREVSASPAEFRRGLLLAFPGKVTGQGNIFNIATDNAAMEVSLTEGSPRSIANLKLPTLFVSIRFTTGTTDAQKTLLAQMDRAMHRGGG